MSRLEGEVALITGSAQGIGATLARDLAREGAKLAAAASSSPTPPMC
jgi:NAD(P)-dependent dehydrogenase (short-subunit alcohol dehydrogenase family)